MTTYNTGNPVPSTEVKDLYDNAENLDFLVNGPDVLYPDRLGNNRKSWAGMEQDFQTFLVGAGWQYIGDYDLDGPLNITARNQIFARGAYLYRIAGGVAIPYTTTTWATDAANFVALDDSSLRSELADGAAPFGASLVGYGSGTVRDFLDSLAASTDSVGNLMRDYGAAGIGGDETAAFEAAEADLNAGVIKGLFIPPGDYVYNGNFTVNVDNRAVWGAGRDATRIIRTNGTFGDWFTVSAPNPATTQIRGVTIAGLTLYAQVDVESGSAIRWRNVHRCVIDDVFLRNYHIGFHIEGMRDSVIQNTEAATNEFWTTMRAGSCHFWLDKPADPTKKSTESNITGFNWTTAASGPNGRSDVEYGLIVAGDMDGVWWNEGHFFGGAVSGLLIDATGVVDLSSPIFNNVWFDQYTLTNVILRGAASTNFRFVEFNNCRMWGGASNCMTIESGCNVSRVDVNGGSIGVTLGQGVLLNAGTVVSFSGTRFLRLNQGNTANGYAVNVAIAGSLGRLIMSGVHIDLSTLYYGVFCGRVAASYELDVQFDQQTVNLVAEISFGGNALVGYVRSQTTNSASSNQSLLATVQQTNIASNQLRLAGTAGTNVSNIFPTWHGRRITMSAGTTWNLVSGGNIRNSGNAASRAIATDDMVSYEYNSITGRWHQVA